MTDIALRLNKVTHHYSGHWQLVIDDLALESGKIYGLIGRNGAGKSTLMRLMAGTESPLKGYVHRSSPHFGMVHAQTSYPSYASLKDLERIFLSKANHQKTPWKSERFREVMNVFGVSKNRTYQTLSTGEKAGLHLALMLAQCAPVWFLDEPTLGIDIVAVNQCLSILSEYFLDDSPCVVLATHQLHELERLADEVLIVRDGQIAWQGETEALQSLDRTFTDGIENLLKQQKIGAIA